MRSFILSALFICTAALAQNPLQSTPLQSAKDAAKRGDYPEALRILTPLAEQGDAKAQYNLALFYQHGAGVEKSHAKALEWLEKAAAQHLPDAQLALGEALLYGENGMTTYDAPAMQEQSTPPQAQRERGIALITQAAEQNLPHAQERLGQLWLNGWRVSEPRGDVKQAAHWLAKAAANGNADAQYSLALLYRDGEGVTRDCDQALQWFEKAGDQGDWAAYGEISRMYARGICVAPNAEEAAKWEAKALKPLENRAKTQP